MDPAWLGTYLLLSILQEYILNQRGLIQIVGLHKDNISRGGQTSKGLTIKYIEELTPKLYQQLLKIYQIDFDLFGYKAPNLSNAWIDLVRIHFFKIICNTTSCRVFVANVYGDVWGSFGSLEFLLCFNFALVSSQALVLLQVK